jgi:methyl-accepting chemotaxis protein
MKNLSKEELISRLESINRSNAVIEFDLNGIIIKANNVFLSAIGYLPNELSKIVGKHHRIFVKPEYAKSKDYEEFWKTLKKGQFVSGEFERVSRDGSIVYLQATYNPIFDENGNIIKIVKYALDVTFFKKQEQETQNRLNAINRSNAVIEFTLDGKIITANDIFLQTMGFELKDIVGKHHRVLVTEKDEHSITYGEFWKKLKNGESIAGEFERVKSSGEHIWLQATYNPILDLAGNPYKVMKIAVDITETIQQQKEIEKKNTYLEHASKILRHDMHSGINTYIPRGITSLERRLTDEQVKELKIEAPLKMIKEGLSHAQKVYRGVFEFTNLVRPNATLSKKTCNLSEILSSYLSSTAYKSQVLIEDLGSAEVNESLLCTSLDNLIRNGLKYNDSSTKFVKLYRVNDTIFIEDNGRGLSSEDFKILSQPYTRKEDQKETGTGLGLNICIAILEEHGFGIECNKLDTIGTQFKINIK